MTLLATSLTLGAALLGGASAGPGEASARTESELWPLEGNEDR